MAGNISRTTSVEAVRRRFEEDANLQAYDVLSYLSIEIDRRRIGHHANPVPCGTPPEPIHNSNGNCAECCDIDHCRRRKIRCMFSHNDMQNNCVNCVRLKKDCGYLEYATRR